MVVYDLNSNAPAVEAREYNALGPHQLLPSYDWPFSSFVAEGDQKRLKQLPVNLLEELQSVRLRCLSEKAGLES